MNNDEILREAVAQSGFYDLRDVIGDLKNEDLDYQKQVSLVLARELVKFRPDLIDTTRKDVVYVAYDGENFSLPCLDLSVLIQEEKPYTDAYIGTYSLSERKILAKLYKGDGTKWVPFYCNR